MLSVFVFDYEIVHYQKRNDNTTIKQYPYIDHCAFVLQKQLLWLMDIIVNKFTFSTMFYSL